jgi:Xaa-Pro aminopeptidase
MTRAAPDVLIHAGTVGSVELRHLIPVQILDPLLYGEHGGRTFAAVGAADAELVREARPDIEILDPYELGLPGLIDGGMDRKTAVAEIALRACRKFDVREAAVPREFPLYVADHLRAGGVELAVDGALFDDRRRSKTASELPGIHRAARATEAGIVTVSRMLAEAEAGPDGHLLLEGEPLTAERLQAAVRGTFDQHGSDVGVMIIAPGAQGAAIHDTGSGPIATGTTVVVDLWPIDRQSGFSGDMTRTFVHGSVPDDVARWHQICLDVHERVVPEVRPGITGERLWELACDVIEAAGEATRRSPGDREAPNGFFHALGHGVGLDVHESPLVGPGGETLVPGDVITIEPGIYRAGYGGVRLEDLFLVTEDGCERLTHHPMDLAPA